MKNFPLFDLGYSFQVEEAVFIVPVVDFEVGLLGSIKDVGQVDWKQRRGQHASLLTLILTGKSSALASLAFTLATKVLACMR